MIGMILFGGVVCAVEGQTGVKTLPTPRPLPKLEDDCVRFSSPEFERLVSQLKAERDGLEADLQSFSKQSTPSKRNDEDRDRLQKLLQLTLERLQQRQKKPMAIVLPEVDLLPKETSPVVSKEPSTKGASANEAKSDPAIMTNGSGSLNPVQLGNAQFRAQKFEEALAAFRQVDLKSKKVEERAAIQFLMARCLARLGKEQQAVELLRDAAESSGDERVASYAQWHLEMHRWQREVNDRLENIRQRRLAAEKQP